MKLSLGELNETEMRVMRLLKHHLALSHTKLSRLMEMEQDDLHTLMNPLEQGDLVTSEQDTIRSVNIYCPTALGLYLVREYKEV